MKILLSCVNSLVSFIGFDTDAASAFWYCPANQLRACGAAYDPERKALLVATDTTLTRIGPNGRIDKRELPGPHANMAHSVHLLEGMGVGVADTGNSRVLVFGDDLQGAIEFSPLEGWGTIGPDVIHLNDFVSTPYGLVASCFNYRPYRAVETPGTVWQKNGYGLLLSLEKRHGRNVGKVVGSGLDCPHSLVWKDERLYCCASATGEFVRLAPTPRGQFVEEERIAVSSDRFLRGALPLEDGGWILGGSSSRRTDGAKGMAVFILDGNNAVQTIPVGPIGEIYDILPWDREIMSGAAEYMHSLPPSLGEEGYTYPPPCVLP